MFLCRLSLPRWPDNLHFWYHFGPFWSFLSDLQPSKHTIDMPGWCPHPMELNHPLGGLKNGNLINCATFFMPILHNFAPQKDLRGHATLHQTVILTLYPAVCMGPIALAAQGCVDLSKLQKWAPEVDFRPQRVHFCDQNAPRHSRAPKAAPLGHRGLHA